jgi:hypothetical protein
MDLGAYANIETLEPIAEANGIKVNRIRGYRLMEYENPMDEENMKELIKDRIKLYCLDYFSRMFDDNGKLMRLWYHGYMAEDIPYLYNNGLPNWKKIHGRARKELKFEIKKAKKAVLKQYELWNKYAGRNDVLYIHARLGSTSWSYVKHTSYNRELWYLGSIDDWDTSYCDIYAKIDPKTVKERLEKLQEENENA